MKKLIINLLILVSPFIVKGQDSSESEELLIKKGELGWLLEEHKENVVLKKRVVVKDTTIVQLERDNKIIREENKNWKKVDSLHTQNEIVLSQEAVKEKGKGLLYKGDNRRLRKQNFLLKVGIVILAVVAIKEEISK